MPIKCTHRDLDFLRDANGTRGPLSKLRLAEPPAVTIVDQLAILKFTKTLANEVETYETSLHVLLKKYGIRRSTSGGQTVYVIPPEKEDEYEAEKKKLDEIECEIVVVPLDAKYYAGKVALSVLDLEHLEKFVVFPTPSE
jgi:hypothetical protein